MNGGHSRWHPLRTHYCLQPWHLPPFPWEVRLLLSLTDPQEHSIPQSGNLEGRKPGTTIINLVVSIYQRAECEGLNKI